MRPTLRAAAFGDIPALLALLKETHARSRLARFDLDDKRAKALFLQAIQKHGHSFFAAVTEQDGLEAFIVGGLQPIYVVGRDLEATDLFWIARPGAHAASAGRLLRAFHKWAWGHPNVARIRQGVPDLGLTERTPAEMLTRQGFRAAGAIYEKERTP